MITSGGIGAVIRDGEGMLLAAFCDKLKSSIQQNLIQLLAVHKTHILSIEAGFWKLQVECEDKIFFRALTIDRDDVKDTLSRLLVVSLIPISKSVKHASPILAKHPPCL